MWNSKETLHTEKNEKTNKNEEKEESSWFGVLVAIGVVAVGAFAYAKIVKKIWKFEKLGKKQNKWTI